MQRCLTQREFLEWQRFYAANPFDDMHRYHRPAAMVAEAMSGSKQDSMRKRLEWLRNAAARAQPSAAVPAGDWTAADLATMKALME